MFNRVIKNMTNGGILDQVNRGNDRKTMLSHAVSLRLRVGLVNGDGGIDFFESIIDAGPLGIAKEDHPKWEDRFHMSCGRKEMKRHTI